MSTGIPAALSVPARFVTPRALTVDEIRMLCVVADVLIPATERDPSATAEPGFEQSLVVAAHARADAFDEVVELLASLDDLSAVEVDRELRRLHADEESAFQPLSAIVAGAWTMLPAVMARLGYEGQKAEPAPIDLAADEIMTGILDDVIERGPIFRPVD